MLAKCSSSSSRETQYTGPGHGIDAHVADRARLHARVYNCTTQLQRVLDIESFDVVPSHAGEKITNANTNHTRELEWAGCKKSKKGCYHTNKLVATTQTVKGTKVKRI